MNVFRETKSIDKTLRLGAKPIPLQQYAYVNSQANLYIMYRAVMNRIEQYPLDQYTFSKDCQVLFITRSTSFVQWNRSTHIYIEMVGFH